MQVNKIKYVMYMIWQVIVSNGQQRPVASATILVLHVEAIATTAATTRASVAAPLRPAATTSVHSVHFYTCRTECWHRGIRHFRGTILKRQNWIRDLTTLDVK